MGHTETFLLGHIHQLEQAGVDIPDNWFWYKSRVGETLDLTNEIVQELHALHEKALEKPNVRTLLEELLYMLELMIQSGPRSGEDQAEKKRIVADLIDKTTKLLEQEVEGPTPAREERVPEEFSRKDVKEILTRSDFNAYTRNTLGDIEGRRTYEIGSELFEETRFDQFRKKLKSLTESGGQMHLKYWSDGQIEAKPDKERKRFNDASRYWLRKQLQGLGVEFKENGIEEAGDYHAGEEEGVRVTAFDVLPSRLIIEIPAQPKFSRALMGKDLIDHLIAEYGLDLESTEDPVRPELFKTQHLKDDDIPEMLEQGVPIATALRKQDLVVEDFSLLGEETKEEITAMLKEKVKEVNSAIAYIRKTVNKPLSNPEIIIGDEIGAYWVFKAQTA